MAKENNKDSMRTIFQISVQAIFVLLLFIKAISSGHSEEVPAISKCDELASVPSDPNLKIKGVYLEKINAKEAIAACERAVNQFPGNPRFKFQLARALIATGRFQEAKVRATEAVQGGYPIANVVLGYLAGLREFNGQNDKESTSLYRAAAESGLPMAWFAYAGRLSDGVGIKADMKTALGWFERAVEAEFPPALISKGGLLESGRVYKKNTPAALGLFKRAAELGHLNGLNRYGQLLSTAEGKLRNRPLAIQVFKQCISQDFNPCHLSYGKLLAEGASNIMQLKEAEKHLRAALEADVAGTANQLAYLLEDNKNIEASDYEITELFKKATEEGFYLAAVKYGERLIAGRGTEKDTEKGIEVIRKTANEGIFEAQVKMARIFSDGIVVKQDLTRAAKWRKKYSDVATPKDLFAIAKDKLKYSNSKKNTELALSEMTKIAESGSLEAIHYIGEFYLSGGPYHNLETAFKWFKRGAEKGGESSTSRVGEMLIDGRGTRKDIDRGFQIMTRIAESEDPFYQYKLGTKFIELGREDEGEIWLRKAVKQNYKYAMRVLGAFLIKSKRNKAEVSEGIRLLKNLAAAGEAYDMWSVGHYYQNGIGVDVDYGEAYRWFKKSADLGYASAINQMGPMYFEGQGVAKNYTIAIEWYLKAAKRGYNFAYVQLGHVYENGFGVERNSQKAAKFYKKGADKNEPMAMAAYAMLSATGEISDLSIQAAVALAEKAIGLLEKGGPRYNSQKAHVYQNLGHIKNNRGRFSEAEEYFRKALTIHETHPGKKSSEYVWALEGYASVLAQSGRFDEAETIFEEALKLVDDLNDDLLEYSVWGNFGLLREAQGRLQDAIKIFNKMLEKLRFAFGTDTRNAKAHINAALGRINLELGQLDSAKGHLGEALVSLDKLSLEGTPHYLRVIADLARTYTSLGDHKSALPLHRRALEGARKIGILDHPLVTTAAVSFSNTLSQVGKYKESLDILREVHHIYATRLERQSRESLSDRTVEREVMVQALEQQLGLLSSISFVGSDEAGSARVDLAFKTIQLLHRTSASEAVSQMAARFATKNDKLAQIIRGRQDLLKEWRDLNKLDAAGIAAINSRSGNINSIGIRSASRKVKVKIENIDRIISAEFPGYYNLTSTSPVSLVEVKPFMAADEALLAYFFGAEKSFAFLVTNAGNHFLELKFDRVEAKGIELGAEELEGSVGILRRGLDLTGLNKLPSFDTTEAFELYQRIFKPVAPFLKGVRHVFIVPDGALTGLPLGVLVTERTEVDDSDPASYRRVPWLARKYAMSILPSVSSLKALRTFEKRAQASRPFLGIGDPELEGAPGEVRGGKLASLFTSRGVADVKAVRELTRLPESREELQSLARSLNAGDGSLLVGRDATETKVKAAPLSEYRVIAFATHGLVAGQLEGVSEPSLVLTPPEKATEMDDGLLTASEVAQLNLNADWVILSACNTAAADGTPGAQGLSGLAKAFFYAGSQALLVSHWPVVSDAAVALTTRMLALAKKGMTRAEAHQQAMMALIDTGPAQNAHPAIWAPFVVVGEGGR